MMELEHNHAISLIINDHITLMSKIVQSMLPKIQKAVQWITEAMNDGKKILIAGNGGSAADAQHLAAEFIGRFCTERRPLPAIALTTDTSVLTAIGNDYGFDKIFSHQIEGLVREGDIFLAISTSGDSRNLLEAVEVCKNKSAMTIGLLGNNGGKLRELVDLPIIIESNNTARIQEAHITIIHIICELVENTFSEQDNEIK